jgi:hypothetical protein
MNTPMIYALPPTTDYRNVVITRMKSSGKAFWAFLKGVEGKEK